MTDGSGVILKVRLGFVELRESSIELRELHRNSAGVLKPIRRSLTTGCDFGKGGIRVLVLKREMSAMLKVNIA